MKNITVGELLYSESFAPDGTFKDSSLLFVDTEPNSDDMGLLVTWVAQMEDYGSGLEVYFSPTAGEVPVGKQMSKATDENIRSFTDVIKKSENGQEQLNEWVDIIGNSEDYSPLLQSEKERLLKLLKSV